MAERRCERRRMQFVTQLFGTSSVERLREQSKNKVLRRALTAKDLVSIGLGTMIGGGIFTTIGTGVKGAGPAVIISYLIAGLTSFFAALCYAELGAMVPVAGSAYTYAYATLGKLFAWIIGFALIFEYGISAAPVAQQFSAAIQDVFKSVGVTLPQWAQTSNLIVSGPWWLPGSYDVAHSQYDVLGAAFVLALSLLLSVGIRESATTNNIFVVLKISALIVFVIAGLFLFHAANLHDFNPHGWGKLVPFGGAAESSQPYSIIPIAAFVFFSYIGFDTATTTAEECKNPQRDVPLGVIGALAIGTIIYCATAIVLVGDMNWTLVPVKNPLVAALAPLHLPVLNWVITIGVLAGTTSVALASLLGQSRIFYVMARDRMLPPFVAGVNPRTKTPVLTTVATGVIVSILAGIVPLGVLLSLVNIGTLSAFAIVCGGVLVLRFKEPDAVRPFRAPFAPAVPIAGLVLCLYLMFGGLSGATWLRFIIWFLVGVAVYALYGFRHSLLREKVQGGGP